MRISGSIKSVLPIAVATLLLSACNSAVSMVSDAMQPSSQERQTAAPKTSGFKTEVDTAKAFAGKRDVVIGGFKVSFVTREKSSSKPRGGLLSGPSVARAAAETYLADVPNEMMQAITDAAYADFKAQLKAQGYNVRPFSFLTGNKTFNGATTKASPLKSTEPMPAMNADALIFAPSGQKLRLFAVQGDGVQAYGWGSPEASFSQAAAELGVPVLDAFYVVDFTDFDGYSSRTTAAMSVGQMLKVIKGDLYITAGQGGTFSTNQGRISLAEWVYSEAQFCSIEKREKSGAGKVGSVLATGMSVLLGGGTRSFDEFDFKADAGKYRAIATTNLTNANAALIGKMAALR